MSSLTAYYIDDQVQSSDELKRREVLRYASRLAKTGELSCIPLSPKPLGEYDNEFFSTPDLFLIDYDLSLVQEDGEKVGYGGASLATEIRSKRPDCPIILITREDVLQQIDHRTKKLLLSRFKVFDELILKSQINADLGYIQNLVISLTLGMQTLAASSTEWSGLVGALRANEEESNLLKEASPPLRGGEWIVVEATDWIRNVIIEFPGILYDDIHMATILGVSVDAFKLEAFRELFAPAMYDGVFSDHYKRWWRNRAIRIARDFIERLEVEGPLNKAFSSAFAKHYEHNLESAICVWDCLPLADWVCYVLRKPVKLEHTVRYYPDSDHLRPSIMDEARVSFRAIWGFDRDQYSSPHEFDKQLLDSDATELIKKIEERKDPCSHASN